MQRLFANIKLFLKEMIEMREPTWLKNFLIFLAGFFLFVMLIMPLILVAKEALAKGLEFYFQALTDEFALKALFLTIEATIFAVILNTIFGISSA